MSSLDRYDVRFADVRAGRIIIGVLVAITQLVSYQLMLQYNADRLHEIDLWQVEMLADQRIPLIPEFAFVYFLYIPGLIVPALLDMPMRLYLRYATALVLAVCVSSVGFALVPLHIEHEHYACAELACSGLVLLRDVDPGLNLLPSLHASQTLLAAAVLFVASRYYRVRTFWWAWGGFLYLPVIASTLFTKQHYIVDLLAGFLVGLFCWKLSRFFIGEEPDGNAV